MGAFNLSTITYYLAAYVVQRMCKFLPGQNVPLRTCMTTHVKKWIFFPMLLGFLIFITYDNSKKGMSACVCKCAHHTRSFSFAALTSAKH